MLGADLGNQNIADPDNGVENIAEHDPERKTLQIQILVKKKTLRIRIQRKKLRIRILGKKHIADK